MTFNQFLRALNRRPHTTCSGCGYTWHPRGKNYSLKCPNCGAALVYNQGASGGVGCLGKFLILLIGIPVLIYFIGNLTSTPGSKSPPSPSRAAPSRSTIAEPPKQQNDGDINGGIVTVEDLSKSYLADKTAADRRYRGRNVEWNGVVHTAKWSPFREEGLFVVLETGTKQFVVTAWFSKSHEKEVLSLRPGQTIRVAGKVGDVSVVKNKGEVFVSLDDCERIDVPKIDESQPRQVAQPEVSKDNEVPSTKQASAPESPTKDNDSAATERAAADKLKLAKQLLGKNKDAAKRRLESIVKDYPNTKAAAEASELLNEL